MITRPGQHRRTKAAADTVDGPAPGCHQHDARREPGAPRPEFVRDLRSQLMREATAALASRSNVIRLAPVPPAAPARRDSGLRRRLGALVAAFAVAGGSLGLATASAHALPGDMLYPVKRGLENAQLALDRDPSEVGPARLALAQRRLQEVQALTADNGDDHAGAGEAELVRRTLDDFALLAEQGADSLLNAYADNNNHNTPGPVTSFTRSSTATLAGLTGTVPEPAETSYATAAQTLSDLRTRAAQACSTCPAPALTDLPTPFDSQAHDLVGPDQSSNKPTEQHSGQATPDHPTHSTSEASTAQTPAAVPTRSAGLPDDTTAGEKSSGSSSAGTTPERPATIKPLKKPLDPRVTSLITPAASHTADHP